MLLQAQCIDVGQQVTQEIVVLSVPVGRDFIVPLRPHRPFAVAQVVYAGADIGDDEIGFGQAVIGDRLLHQFSVAAADERQGHVVVRDEGREPLARKCRLGLWAVRQQGSVEIGTQQKLRHQPGSTRSGSWQLLKKS